jgi:hypothetical protein
MIEGAITAIQEIPPAKFFVGCKLQVCVGGYQSIPASEEVRQYKEANSL